MDQLEKEIDDNNQELDLSETEVMKVAVLIDKIDKILKDKYSLSIIAELIINYDKKFTAKELENIPTIDMKKSLLYSKLKQLEDYDFIKSEYHVKENENRGYAQKLYSIDRDHFESLIKTMVQYQRRPELVRESKLVFFSMLQAFIDREVKVILNTSNEDYIKNFSSKFKDINFGTLQFFRKNEFEFFHKRKKKLNEEINEFIKENRDNNDAFIEPYFIYSGFLYFPEVEQDNR